MPKEEMEDEVIMCMDSTRVNEEDSEDRTKWRQIIGEVKYNLGCN